MKDFKYYETTDIPYFGFDWCNAREKELRDQINNDKLTAKEREEQLKCLQMCVRSEAAEKNKPHNAKIKSLVKEFWQDARKELNYSALLDEEGVVWLEKLAREEGEHRGFSLVFEHLEKLDEVMRKVITHQRKLDNEKSS
jgi:hypothetical protein